MACLLFAMSPSFHLSTSYTSRSISHRCQHLRLRVTAHSPSADIPGPPSLLVPFFLSALPNISTSFLFLFFMQPGPFFRVFSFAKNASHSVVAVFPLPSSRSPPQNPPPTPSPTSFSDPFVGCTPLCFPKGFSWAPCFSPRCPGQFIYLCDLFLSLVSW